jgi:hypothetical protein
MGTLAAHSVGYATHGGGDGVHGYLRMLGLPFAAGAVLAWVVVAPMARRAPLPSVRALVASQLGLFVAQEVLERVAHQVPLRDVASELASQGAVRTGLALQLVTAVALLLVVNTGRRVVGWIGGLRWRPREAFWSLPQAERGLRARTCLVGGVLDSAALWSRGPPAVFVH